MAHTYEEMRKMKVTQLREIADALQDERLQGHNSMNKEHLLPILCQVLGVEAHAHHEVVGVDKGAIKGRIRTLKVEDNLTDAGGVSLAWVAPPCVPLSYEVRVGKRNRSVLRVTRG